jgi:hypothetical protein
MGTLAEGQGEIPVNTLELVSGRAQDKDTGCNSEDQ